MLSTIEIHRRGPAAVLALAGLDARGMFNTAMLQELKQAIEDLQQDDSVRVLVLTGKDKLFCTGGNFGNEANARAVFAGAFKALVVAMAESRLPIVAAVNGRCTAGGMTLLGSTDYAIAVSEAEFGYVELAFGAFPMLAAVTVPPHMPKKVFFSWAYKSLPVPASEMLRLDLVNEVVAQDRLWDAVDHFCTDLAGKSAFGIAAGRRLWYATVGAPPVAFLDQAYAAVTGFPPVKHFE